MPESSVRNTSVDSSECRLRAICLGLPQATEQETWGDPTFRIRNKIFAMVKRGDGRLSIWLKAAPGIQEALIAQDAERYFFPPYVGSKGWIGIRLDSEIDWDEIGDLVAESFRLIAPKRLLGTGQ